MKADVDKLKAENTALREAGTLAMQACQDNLKAFYYKNEPALFEAFKALEAILVPKEKMLFRKHRGGLEESMATVVELEPTLDALAEYLKCDRSELKVQYYCYDARIDWDTFLVTDSIGVVGMTNKDII